MLAPIETLPRNVQGRVIELRDDVEYHARSGRDAQQKLNDYLKNLNLNGVEIAVVPVVPDPPPTPADPQKPAAKEPEASLELSKVVEHKRH